MFGIGMPELILILAIALIVIGSKKLPDLAKSLGRAMREFKKATHELKESIEIESEMSDVKKSFDDLNQDLRDTIDVSPESQADSPAKATPDNKKSSSGKAKKETESGTEESGNG